MNIAYRLVWNSSHSALVPVPESARRARKAGGPRLLGAVLLAGLSCAVQAMPSGGQAISGTAAISQAGSVMTVTNSANAIVNWQKFAIDAGEAVKFLQPSASSAVLNRVVGPDPSAIYGLLQSNGRVWLVNPAGILVGPSGRVDTAGFVASTLDVSNQNFLAGRLLFQQGATPPGSVVNQGSISTPSGGQVYLVGPEVRNEGSIAAPNGEAILAAGQRVQLFDSGTPGVSVEVTGDGTATNLGSILADAGRVGIAGLLVRNSGTLDASSVVAEGGRIFLRAGQDITLGDASTMRADGARGGSVSLLTQDGAGQIAGTLTARGLISAQGDGPPGSGGFVETSAAKVDLNGVTVKTNGGSWLIDPVDFNIAPSGGDISGSALAAGLNANDVTILSSSGSTAGAGDINVNDAVAWNSSHGLTLSALHSVEVNAPISNAGGGGLTLRADNLGACVAGNNSCGSVAFAGPGHVTLNGGALDIYYNPPGSNNAADANGVGPQYLPVDYSGNATLANGSSLTAWMLVNDANQLQAMNTDLRGSYALGRDIDASGTAGWNGGAGFVPVGSISTVAFSGRLDGGGHTVSGLTIDRPTEDGVGLFGATTSGARLSNLDLEGGSVSGNQYVGQLVGANAGTVTDSTVAGFVAGLKDVGGMAGTNSGTIRNGDSNSVVQDTGSPGIGDVNAGENANVGGLVGSNSGSISDACSSGTVFGPNDVGGLVGYNYNRGRLDNVQSSATVTGTNDVGGLLGDNDATVAHAHASGSVTGSNVVGGLVGNNGATITDSDASGNVAGTIMAGGLAGHNIGRIANAHASGSVTGGYNVGGLVGSDDIGDHSGPGVVGGTIESSFATGAVSGHDAVGGLVGFDLLGPIHDSFSSGAVQGIDNIGGLVGYMSGGTIDNSHATGPVTAWWNFGGLVGWNSAAIGNSYATGNLTGPVDIANIMGGLVGENHGPITDSWATSNILGSDQTGGLVGVNYPGATITRSHATGRVIGRGSGGLVGSNAADIVDSYATGLVGGENGSGGLVAFNTGNIVHSHASGTVNTSADGGGLAGYNSGTIIDSYATGAVNGGDDMGGLVGTNGGTISGSYATGDVVSRGGNPYGVGNGDRIGGLVGFNAGIIAASYATGDVTSLYGNYVGGLVGLNVAGESHPTPSGVQVQPGIISDSYATGKVSGVDNVGGLVGRNEETLPGLIGLDDNRAAITDSHATGSATGLGDVGGLVGWSNGIITDSYATGDVGGRGTLGGLVGHNEERIRGSHATGDVSGSATAGGLVGDNGATGTIFDSYARGDVYGLYGAGGLVGSNAGVIVDAHATGSVNSQEDGSESGGLAGQNAGTIIDSYATGDVLSWNTAGGLVGVNAGSVIRAHATGDVRAYKGPAGGLAGSNAGSISIAYATGDVTGSRIANGGLVGTNGGTLSQVFATGDVVANSFSGWSLYNGGLVGYNAGSIENAYARGSVTTAPGATADYNAGLVAYNTGSIAHTYSTGAVSGAAHNGGLVAFNSGTVTDSYWDITTSGQTTSAAGTGLKDKKMKQRKSFVGFDFANIWTIRQGRGYPQLRAFF
ncbi:MAG TPA: GLUG motif-containing protein [Rhodocyclaceae bacterium]